MLRRAALLVIILALCRLAAGQFGPPNYSGSPSTNPIANYIVPQPATPNLSAACTVNGLTTSCKKFAGGLTVSVTDNSYAIWLGQMDYNTASRCTGPLSAQEFPNNYYAAGIGGSSLVSTVNANGTLAGIQTVGREFMTLISSANQCVAPTYGGGPADVIANPSTCNITTECSIFITQAMNLSHPGSNSATYNFGTPYADPTDPSVFWVYGDTTANATSNLQVYKYTFNGTNQHLSNFIPDGSFTIAASPTVDFQYALPVSWALQWAANTSYAAGVYVIHTLVAPPNAGAEFLQYVTNTPTAYLGGDIIVPGTNGDGITSNSGECMFKAEKSGTTAGTGNSINFGNHNPCQDNVVTDGAVKWQSLSSTAQFLFQNTGASGTSSASAFQWIQTPATLATTCSITSGAETLTCPSSTFTVGMAGQSISISGAGNSGGTVPLYCKISAYTSSTTVTVSSPALHTETSASTVALSGHPDLGNFNADGANIWTNVGPAYAPVSNDAWDDASGIGADDATFGMAISSNSYGPWTKGGNDYYSQGGADQNTGFWLTSAKIADPISGYPTFYTLNTLTGIQTNNACEGIGATLGNCTSPVETVLGGPFNGDINPCPSGAAGEGPCPSTPAAPNCATSIHNEKLEPSDNFVFMTGFYNFYDGMNGTTYCASVENYYGWLPNGISSNDTYDANVNFQIAESGLPHFAVGNHHVWAFHDGGQGLNYGIMTAAYLDTNMSGNGGGLPPGCGNGTGQTACILYSGAQQPLYYTPYTFAIPPSTYSGSHTVTNNNYTTNGIAQTAYGTLNPGVEYNCTNGTGTCPGLPTETLEPSGTGLDQHFDATYNPGLNDAGWLIGGTNSLSNTIAVNNAFQNEIMGFPMTSCQTGAGTAPYPAGCPIPGTATAFGTAKRFFHIFQLMNAPNFSVNIPISETCPTGNCTLFGTDWGGQFGSSGALGNGTGDPINGSGQLGYLPASYVAFGPSPLAATCFCGPPWQASFPYVTGNMISPLATGAGSTGAAGLAVFEAISGGTSGSTQPVGFANAAIIGPTVPVNVTSCSTSAGTATCITATQSFTSGGSFPASIVIAGNTASNYNNTPSTGWTLTGATSTQVQFAISGSPSTGTGGTVYQQGSQITDSGVTWQTVALAPNQRGDVVILNLNPYPVGPAPQLFVKKVASRLAIGQTLNGGLE